MTLENAERNEERMEESESEHLPQPTYLGNKGKHDLFDEWMDSIEHLDAFAKKIKTAKLVTLAKNIVSAPIESISTNVSIPVKSIYDSFSIKAIESKESVKNSFPFNMISDSAYLLALNVFISKIGKEALNNKELKHEYLEPIKEETQPINLGTNDDPKMI